MGNIGAVWQYLEALAELMRAYYQLRRHHFSRWSALISAEGGCGTCPSFEDRMRSDLQQSKPICKRLNRLARRLDEDRFSCLVQAIAAKRMLARRNVDSGIRLGVNRSETKPDVKWGAHAWLEVHGHILLGGNTSESYTAFRAGQGKSGADV